MTGWRRSLTWLPLAALVAVAAFWGPALPWQAMWPRVQALGPAWPALAALGLLGSHGLRALRLRAEWGPRCGVGAGECLRVSLLHSAAVNLMPMRSGELGFPLLLRQRWGVPLLASGASLLCMRLQDALVLAWLGALSACAVAWGRGRLDDGLAVAAVSLATLALLRLATRPATWPRPQHPLLRRGAEALATTLAHTTPATWAWCVLNWLLKLATLALLMVLLTGDRSLAGWCAAWAGEAAASLPVQAPAGFGTYEAAAALGARLAGAPALQQHLLAALAVHLFTIAVTLLGALVASVGGTPQRSIAHSAPGPA